MNPAADCIPVADESAPKLSRGRWRIGLGLVLLGVLAGGAVWYHVARTQPNHLRTVVPGVLYRSAWPTASQLDAMVKQYGIRTVVNLCLEDEEVSLQEGNWEREKEQCRELGVSLVHFRLPGNTPPTEEQAREWLRICTSPESQPVLVHCAQGVIRTNGVVAIYQIDVLGMDNETVLRGLPAFGHSLFKPSREALNSFILGWQQTGYTVASEAVTRMSADGRTPAIGRMEY